MADVAIINGPGQEVEGADGKQSFDFNSVKEKKIMERLQAATECI